MPGNRRGVYADVEFCIDHLQCFRAVDFIGGMTGALFYDQSMGIAIALFASLAVSMIVLPVYFKVLYQKVHKRKLEKGEALVADDEKNVTKTNRAILRWYEKTQSWMFAHLRLCLFLFLLSAPGLVVMFLISEKRQMPEVSYTDAIMYVDWNAGISVQENDRRISQVLEHCKKGVEATTSMVGTQDFCCSIPKTLPLPRHWCILSVSRWMSSCKPRSDCSRMWLRLIPMRLSRSLLRATCSI